jgi:Protein of unknown function (DUF4058)
MIYRLWVDISENATQSIFNVQDLIPCFPLPLRSEDICLQVDLRSLLDGIYDPGYGFVIDYTQPPIPALPESDLNWVRQWLAQ